jgi:hypothetical protein
MQKRKLSSAAFVQDKDEDGVESGALGTPRRARRTRGQIRQEEDLATPPSALARVGVTPPSKNERMLRGRIPTCSDYGISRHFSFKGNGYFFCHACDLWDSLPPDRSKNCSRTSKMLACTAKHTSFSHPTTYCKDYCRRGAIMSPVVTTNHNSDSIGSTSTEDEEELYGAYDDDDDTPPFASTTISTTRTSEIMAEDQALTRTSATTTKDQGTITVNNNQPAGPAASSNAKGEEDALIQT